MGLELLIQQNALAIKQLKDDAKQISDLPAYTTDLANNDLLIFSIDSSGQSVAVTFAKLLSQMQGVQSSVNITKQIILDSLGYIPEDASLKGAGNGYAPLVIGKIPTQFLPSYVDEIIEGTYIDANTFNDTASIPVVGGQAKIYQDTSTGNAKSGFQFRWSGTIFSEIQKSAGTTDTVVEGINNLYFTNSRVLNTLITGLNLANTDSITSADTVLSALGKLQAQLVFNYNSSEDKLPKGTYVGTADDVIDYAIAQDAITLQSAKDYADGLNDTTVDHTYLTIPAMIAAQNEQLMDDLIKVIDAGADSRITGKAYYFYNGTTAGTIDDYHLLSNSEVTTLTGQAVIDALGYTPEPLNVPPIADTKVKVYNLDGSVSYEDYGVGTAVERTRKEVSNTTQYTLIAADYTDFYLDFTANLGQTIALNINTGIIPANGQAQIISSGNNFIVPTAGTGITFIKPPQTNLKTVGKGSWLGIIETTTADSLSINGSLESVGVGGRLLSKPFNYTGGLQEFTLPVPILEIYSVLVGNSSLQRTQYTYTGSKVTITDTLTVGAVIEINYKSNEIPPAGDTTAPTTPTNLANPSKTDTTSDLTWTASTDEVGVVSYNVYKDAVLYSNVASNSGQVTGLTASTAYSFTVSALDAAGNQSAQSTALSVTTNAATAALLLDDYPNAKLAYSFRKLRTAYAGAAIRVRRGTDNVEQDINFLNGVLDTAALLSFIGSGNGFVHTVYDQSGNGINWVNASTVAGSQPTIVSSGALVLKNSKPVMLSTTASTNLSSISFSITSELSTDFTVITNTNAISMTGFFLPGEKSYGILQSGGTTATFSTGIGTVSTFFNGGLFTGNRDALYTSVSPALSLLSFTNIDLRPYTQILLDQISAPVVFPPNHFAEKIIYDSDQEVNRVAIQNNINAFYGIY